MADALRKFDLAFREWQGADRAARDSTSMTAAVKAVEAGERLLACTITGADVIIGELDDWRDAHRRIMEESCSDESHCLCVPELRRAIEALEKRGAELVREKHEQESLRREGGEDPQGMEEEPREGWPLRRRLRAARERDRPRA